MVNVGHFISLLYFNFSFKKKIIFSLFHKFPSAKEFTVQENDNRYQKQAYTPVILSWKFN